MKLQQLFAEMIWYKDRFIHQQCAYCDAAIVLDARNRCCNCGAAYTPKPLTFRVDDPLGAPG